MPNATPQQRPQTDTIMSATLRARWPEWHGANPNLALAAAAQRYNSADLAPPTKNCANNRCGHNPHCPRGPTPGDANYHFAHQPKALVEVLNQVERLRNDLDNRIFKADPSSSRKRLRSERREAIVITCYVLIRQWLSLESLRCGLPGHLNGFGDFRECPTAKQIAWQATKLFPGIPIGAKRINRALNTLAKKRLINRGEQRKEQKNGVWRAGPKLIVFKRRFFLALGGEKTWNAIREAGEIKIAQIQKSLMRKAPQLLPRKQTSSLARWRIDRYIMPTILLTTAALRQKIQSGPEPPRAGWRKKIFPQLSIA